MNAQERRRARRAAARIARSNAEAKEASRARYREAAEAAGNIAAAADSEAPRSAGRAAHYGFTGLHGSTAEERRRYLRSISR